MFLILKTCINSPITSCRISLFIHPHSCIIQVGGQPWFGQRFRRCIQCASEPKHVKHIHVLGAHVVGKRPMKSVQTLASAPPPPPKTHVHCGSLPPPWTKGQQLEVLFPGCPDGNTLDLVAHGLFGLATNPITKSYGWKQYLEKKNGLAQL